MFCAGGYWRCQGGISIVGKIPAACGGELCGGSRVDRSIHGPSDFIQTNVVGTFNLLESVRAYWTGFT